MQSITNKYWIDECSAVTLKICDDPMQYVITKDDVIAMTHRLFCQYILKTNSFDLKKKKKNS